MIKTEEFEEFMRNYQNMVYSTAVRLLGNETDAADISQEVFLKAYERYAELSGNARRGGWLKTVTTNLCLNHLSRYRSRWRFFSEMFSNREEDEDFAATLAAPELEDGPFDPAQQRVLETALQKLPTSQRVPLVLYHFEEMSYEDIARQLGVSIGKVKTDIHRGREALRQKLKMTADGEIAPSFSPPPRSSRPTLMGCV
ncbi:MAG TPA: sigma-70 family RNA polymerase sigma factor [Verrucomicrobiae bacterium]|jgi:RNA polymerase sigma-70 factor (ECF subfamily)|nr:sigma-70 family RNA polymerase sigma factor [Verrucomicrobiae bacterium]